ncbi:DUF4413 domain-containing protein, partial [Weizmannia coagulans]|nr:DUF4413 domain-containing protein [Heyndrickxia coagulans]
MKQREKVDMEVPSEGEWLLAKEICERLELFYDITNLFLGQNYPTINAFFIRVCDIKETLLEWLTSSNEVISTMASSMIQKFDKYWGVCTIGMAISSILDPR